MSVQITSLVRGHAPKKRRKRRNLADNNPKQLTAHDESPAVPRTMRGVAWTTSTRGVTWCGATRLPPCTPPQSGRLLESVRGFDATLTSRTRKPLKTTLAPFRTEPREYASKQRVCIISFPITYCSLRQCRRIFFNFLIACVQVIYVTFRREVSAFCSTETRRFVFLNRCLTLWLNRVVC
uniref:Zinc finger CCHC-type and RNA-binding motif-containing protein 1 n=1 Tax=Mesocestoides corti TaxID=53468 RepID=A0A5K3EG51_MESCO